MKHIFLTFIFLLFYTSFCFSQPKYKRNAPREIQLMYKAAFDEMIAMVKGEKVVSFKRAVFLAENAYYDNKLSYSWFCGEIDKHVANVHKIIKTQPADAQQFKTIGNWAVYVYMVKPMGENDSTVFTYDFNALINHSPTAGFVSKVLKTKEGNCVSLPSFYKLLANEIGANAYLAYAPYHCYLKHKDEQGNWRNLELTNGTVSSDGHIMKSLHITAEQIANGMYMRAISEKECIIHCINVLVNNYAARFHDDILTLSMIETTLAYFPKDLSLLKNRCNGYSALKKM
ncbi:MAG: hypothetical protein LBB53_02260, partial [Prevotellaceae bacterium]|nr:hypothetical protein [Prevotellaceae bacterium]